MVISFRKLETLTALVVTLVMAAGVAGCSLIPENRADCNVVRNQREAGRSDSEIAAALGVSEADVAKCGSSAAGEEGGGGAEGGAAAGQPPPSNY